MHPETRGSATDGNYSSHLCVSDARGYVNNMFRINVQHKRPKLEYHNIIRKLVEYIMYGLFPQPNAETLRPLSPKQLDAVQGPMNKREIEPVKGVNV